MSRTTVAILAIALTACGSQSDNPGDADAGYEADAGPPAIDLTEAVYDADRLLRVSIELDDAEGKAATPNLR